MAEAAWGQAQGMPGLPLVVSQSPSGSSYSAPIQTLLFFTALSFLPAMLLMMTGFTRIVIVLSLLRQALGTQSAPPNQVIVGMSLFLTFFVMGPTFDKVYADAYAPYAASQISFEQAVEAWPGASARLHAQADPRIGLLALRQDGQAAGRHESQRTPHEGADPGVRDQRAQSAFQIAFMIFIPFLVIDMVVASVLMSLGMMMLSPVLVALPFKLMLFRAGRRLEPAAGFAGRQLPDLTTGRSPSWTPTKPSPPAREALGLMLAISAPLLLPSWWSA